MNTKIQFCSNPNCPCLGHKGIGNIVVHSQKERRYCCKKCGRTFSETKGTVFYRLRTNEYEVSNMISLMKHGCPPQAIVATYGFSESTVYSWFELGAEHCKQVHEAIVEQKQINIQHVQADELCITTVRLHSDKETQDKELAVNEKNNSIQSQYGEMSFTVQEVGDAHNIQEEGLSCAKPVAKEENHMWMAMAMDVSTRLWLGGVVDVHRNKNLILALAQKVCACAKSWDFLLSVDGLASYVSSFMFVFSNLILTGLSGRPKRETSPGLLIVQVIKEYSKGKVTEISRRIVRGSTEDVLLMLQRTGCSKINTSYIERLNATFRGRLAALVRKGRAIAHTESPLLSQGMYLVGCSYNFCYFHESLRVAVPEGAANKWTGRTPAMAAGLYFERS